MKFITMKYGLNSESFVVDVIYKGDIIPQDYTLIDVAYYYKWEKDAPMQFFYRIFKHQKVLLKSRLMCLVVKKSSLYVWSTH